MYCILDSAYGTLVLGRLLFLAHSEEITNEMMDLEDTTVTVPQKKNSNPLALTMVSRQYDRDGKGYLDETEDKLRKLDNINIIAEQMK
jgi:hypothetical protein